MRIRFFSLFLVLATLLFCLPTASLAEPQGGCFLIDVDRLDMDQLRSNDYIASHLSAETSGLRVQKYISNSDELAAQVRLTLTQMDTQSLIFDKNYGYQSGTFDSGDIYLPYMGNRTVPYLVTLYIEDWVFAMPFMHLQPRLQQNSASTVGPRLSDLDSSIGQDWLMGTLLDLDLLRAQGSQTIPVCASNSYLIGQATASLSGDNLTVSLAFVAGAQVDVLAAKVYVAKDMYALTCDGFGSLPAYGIGQGIDVSGAASVLLYMPMTLSYDASGLAPFAYDGTSGDVQRQLGLWEQNYQASPLLSQGQPSPPQEPADVPPDLLVADPMPEPPPETVDDPAWGLDPAPQGDDWTPREEGMPSAPEGTWEDFPQEEPSE